MKRPHQWAKLKRITWPVCKGCGLIKLKNEATRRAARAPCERGEKLEREGKALAKRWGLE